MLTNSLPCHKSCQRACPTRYEELGISCEPAVGRSPPRTGDEIGFINCGSMRVPMTATAAALPNRIRSFYAGRFKREWLGKDVIAGLVLASLLVPQGMAYAQLAGLPPITGLYASITCLVAYALVGPSRVLVLGPDSAFGAMIAATVFR